MMALKIAGIILGTLLLLLALILCSKVRIDLSGKNGAISLKVGLGFFRIKLLPRKASKKPAAPRASKRSVAETPLASKRDWGDVLTTALALLEQLRNCVTIQQLRAHVLIGTGDAAKTGLLLGASAALTGMVVPFVEDCFAVRNLQITVDGDFTAAKTLWEARILCTAIPLRMAWVLVRNRKAIYALLKTNDLEG